jgi:hypothetical protein
VALMLTSRPQKRASPKHPLPKWPAFLDLASDVRMWGLGGLFWPSFPIYICSASDNRGLSIPPVVGYFEISPG